MLLFDTPCALFSPPKNWPCWPPMVMTNPIAASWPLLSATTSNILLWLRNGTPINTPISSSIPWIPLLVDNRKNQVDDFQQAVAVTILTTAADPAPAEFEPFLNLYLFKHPYMRSFCQSPDCALLKLVVERESTGESLSQLSGFGKTITWRFGSCGLRPSSATLGANPGKISVAIGSERK